MRPELDPLGNVDWAWLAADAARVAGSFDPLTGYFMTPARRAAEARRRAGKIRPRYPIIFGRPPEPE